MKFESYIPDEKLNTRIDYIEQITAPVIVFRRTIVRHENKTIRSGRIWMQMKYWNEQGAYVSKSENMEKGYKDIKNSKELVRLFAEEGYHWG